MVFYISALRCEAEPLLRRFALKPAGYHGRIALFASSDSALAISGVGRVQAAIATTALAHKFGQRQSANLWINLGVCGHPSLPPGSAVFAHSISSTSSQARFYSHPVVDPPWPSHGLVTSDEPDTSYAADAAIDMEGHGFFAAATHAATNEAIACLKIVSDNRSHPAKAEIDKRQVARWIEARLPSIEAWASETIRVLARAIPDSVHPPHFDAFCESMRLSATEKAKAIKLLRQLHHLGAGLSPEELGTLIQSGDSRSALDSLSRRVAAAAEKQIARQDV